METNRKRSNGMKGYVQVYTGDGKGKTTAAIGLAIRAAGAGWRVFIGQFLKKGGYSELRALDRFSDLITVEQFGTGAFVGKTPSPSDFASARDGWSRIEAVLGSGEYRMVILEEINVAVGLGLVPLGDLLALLEGRPPGVELVLTGRNADPSVVERADLVTEMRPVKHYYEKGVAARTGIEK
jgi:cob(I)alamin adenosyltransferase